MPTLAEVLSEVRAAPAPLAPTAAEDLRRELRAALDDAAARATAGVADDALPARLSRDRIARLLTCEELAVATHARAPALSEDLVRGQVLDRLLHHHVHGAPVPRPAGVPALAVAESAFEAERADDVRAWLDHDPATRSRLAEDATAFAERLAQLGRVPAEWWPRCEDRLRVELAGGAVVCTARLDVVAGGRPTGEPFVILEAKSGRFAQEHRDGLCWYALLGALRHLDEVPAAVVAWSAWDGGIWWQPVTEAVLRGAAARGIGALDQLGDLLRGRAPARTPSRACGWCPAREECPDAA